MEQIAVAEARPSPTERVPWPFDRVRPGQAEFLADARRAMAEGRHLLAHAPTGIGKTAVALVASLGVALDTGKTVLFLTARQSQHRIAIETLRRLESKGARVPAVDVISKQDMCLQPNRPEYGRAFHEFCELKVRTRACTFYNRDDGVVVTAVLQRALHVQELVQASSACHVCPHKVAMDAAERAAVVVCDYNYVFSDILEWTLQRLGKGLENLILVVDEAHNLPDRIRAHLGGDLSLTDLLRAVRESKDLDPEASHQLLGVAKSLERFLLGLGAERVAKKEEFVDMVERGLRRGLGHRLTYTDLVEMVSHAAEEGIRRGRSTSLPQLEEFLRRWRDQDEGILRLVVPGNEGKFAFRLMDPSVLSKPVFDRVGASVLMSGTLYPAEMYADLLGIGPERRWIRTYPSPFPPGNRLLLVHPIATTLYTKRSDEMHDLIAREVVAVAACAPENVAAFFPSYELLQEAEGRIRTAGLKKGLLVEHPTWTKAKRDGALEALRLARGHGGAVLLGVQGGSFSEGVDYEGNLLQAVLVVGLPLSPPNIEVESLKDYYIRKFGPSKGYDYAYVFPAVNKVLQAAGRPIRSEKDRAAIVLLEGRLLAPRYARCLPPEFAARTSPVPSREVRSFLAPARE
ncbi:MAG TPA: ATP-dependent DNA helicase [Thermoplasmata archaeon]|nr:ATP-dependent DNA helicase [Thermoplasmata archaeon]